MSQSSRDLSAIPLSGLDGSNPLAFLAAIGVLATFDRMGCAPTMAWRLDSEGWRPLINAPFDCTETLVARLHEGLRSSEAQTSQVWSVNTKLPYSAAAFRQLSLRLADEARMNDRLATDLVAALGVDALVDEKGNFADTSLRMVRAGDSAGNGMCAYAAWIIHNTTLEHLHQIIDPQASALDQGTSLRWDPAELRTRALQWGDPSKEAVLSRRGLNRLALEALPLFTTVPVRSDAVTVGISNHHGQRQQSLTWPIWVRPLSLNVVRSLVALEDLNKSNPDARSLEARGIAVVFRCARFASSTYYSNFTSAEPV